MKPPSPELWYEALVSENGVVIISDDPATFKRKLYEIRRELQDPDLEAVSIMTSKDPNEIWLVKRRQE